ncbi:SH3 domain-containing protein [Paenisporosarcina sp. NPDC076898]|uniref:SH3 domain-containing protein n=1 Tax=unclassified Paenisporosarcina TaxID=2642018 RepID=UPI003CFD3172
MKKLLTASVLATSVLLPINVFADEIPASAVTLKQSEVRKGASEGYEVVASIPKNHSTKILGEYTNSLGETWYRVDLNSTKGWVPAESFYKEYDLKKLVGNQAIITTNNVNLRIGAGSEFKSIIQLPSSEKFSVIDIEKNSKNEVWYKVTSSKYTGWVIQDFLKLVTPSVQGITSTKGSSFIGSTLKLSSSAANMRSGATTSYPITVTVPAATSMKILGSFSNSSKEVWFNVEYKGKKGWILSDLFVLNAIGGETSTTKKALTNGNVHSGATSAYKVVGTVKTGSSYLTHQTFTNNVGEKWVQVTFATGKKGWVLSKVFENSDINTKVVVKNSSVHSGATTNYQIVASIKAGTKLPYHQVFTNSSKQKWYQVSYSAGKKGWIQATAFGEVSTAPSLPETPIAEENKLRISVPVANLRTGPSISYPVASQAKQEDVFVSNEYALDSLGEKWYKVPVISGGSAWLHASVVSTNAEEQVTTRSIQTYNTSVYTSQSFGSNVVTNLKRLDSVQVFEKVSSSDSLTWLRIKTSTGLTGWIPEFETLTTLPIKYGSQQTSIFSGASTTYKAIDTLYAGAPIMVLRSLNGWLNVETQNNKRGWVQSSLVSNEATYSLSNGRVETINGAKYLVWTKPKNINISYSMPSSNVLRVSGDITGISQLQGTLPGVQSTKVEKVAGGKAVLLITFNSNYTYTIRDYDNRLTIKVVQKGLQGKKIIIDAGHGAHDPGARGPNGTLEKTVTLGTAILLKKELEAAGATVLLTRSKDVFLELSQRTSVANNSDYDAFISVHADSYASTSRGTTTFYNASVNFNGPKSYSLAQSVQTQLVKQTGTYNRGVQSQLFYVNRMNELPSILVELAFLSNPKEEALLASEAFRKKAAVGIKNGLNDFFSK